MVDTLQPVEAVDADRTVLTLNQVLSLLAAVDRFEVHGETEAIVFTLHRGCESQRCRLPLRAMSIDALGTHGYVWVKLCRSLESLPPRGGGKIPGDGNDV